MRSWLARASLRTRLPNNTIGTITTGTVSNTSSVSFQLVSISMTSAPAPSTPLRIAIHTLCTTNGSGRAVSVTTRRINPPVPRRQTPARTGSIRW